MPPNPRTIVKDIDPVVESVLLRCLTPDPRSRPTSALAVLAALPGGDPLAEALAAGETPSPEMVAAAGQNVGVSPRWAMTYLAFIAAGLAIFAALNQQTELIAKVPFDKPPEALAEKAREIAQRLGYANRGVSSTYGFVYRTSNLLYVLKHFRDRATQFLATSCDRPASSHRVLVSFQSTEPGAARNIGCHQGHPKRSSAGCSGNAVDPVGHRRQAGGAYRGASARGPIQGSVARAGLECVAIGCRTRSSGFRSSRA
jgi:hypothetical protein